MSRDHQAWLEARIVAVQALTPTVREIELHIPGLGTCASGSHINVRVMVLGQPDQRSYSVVEADGQGGMKIAVKAQPESRGGSRYMWELQPGARIQVTAPGCNFALGRKAPHYLLVAGGIGVTPLVAMAEEIAASGLSVRMVYAARGTDEFAYAERLKQALGGRLQLFDASQGQQMDLVNEIDALPAGAELYMCGPIGLMDAARKAWEDTGRPRSLLRYETFGSSGKHAAREFIVKVPRLGIEVTVPESRSMLEALSEAGVAVLSDCRRGECGLCAMDVIASDGDIDHRDVFFSQKQHQESHRMCACVSRAVGGCITVEPSFRGDPDLSIPEVLAR